MLKLTSFKKKMSNGLRRTAAVGLAVCLILQSIVMSPTVFADAATTYSLGQSYSGFILKSQSYSEEAQAQVFQFEHAVSGGKVTFFSNKDRHKHFNMHVTTPAKDSTGANHILEHAVLSGSERFPSKRAFEIMTSRSVGTDMNAYTSQDSTNYVFSTVNNKDFKNLYEFYLDSLFAPKLLKDPKIFQREGWRYEKDAKTGQYSFNGIVFNEIKADNLESGEVDYFNTQKALFPNTTYVNQSGGRPDQIVNLTYEQVVNTWKKYYQPANMHLMLYGDMNVGDSLKLLNDRYYKNIKKTVVNTDFGKVMPSTKTTKIVDYFDADLEMNLKNKSVVSVSYALPDISREKEYMLMEFENWFNNTNNDMAIDFIYEKEYGENISVALRSDGKFKYLSFNCYNVDDTKAEEMQAWIKKSLMKLVEDGLDTEEIESLQKESKLYRKVGEMSVNRGSKVFHWAQIGLIAKGDPLYHLDVDKISDWVDEEALFNRGIETVLSELIIKNKHIALAVTIPRIDLGEDKEEALQLLAQKRLNAMNSTDKGKTNQQIETFNTWLAAAESPAVLALMPRMTLDDVSYTKTPVNGVIENSDDITWIKHIGDTKGVGKISLFFDMPTLSETEKMMMPLYESVFLKLQTKDLSGYDLKQLQQTYTTGINFTDLAVTNFKTGELKGLKIGLQTKTLEENIEPTMNMLQSMMGERKFNNKDYTKLIVDGLVSDLEQTLMYDGGYVSNTLMNEKLSNYGQYRASELEPQYKWALDIQKKFDLKYPELMKQLNSLHKKVMNRSNLYVSYVGSEAGYTAFKNKMTTVAKLLPADKFSPMTYAKLENKPYKLGVVVPSKVQYVNKGFNLANQNTPALGSYYVFAKLLSEEYAEQRIRLEGGAYGGGFKLSNDTIMSFSSYRDPNLGKTVLAMDNSIEWLKKRKETLTQEDLNAYIIPLVASYDVPVTLFEIAAKEDMYLISGNSLEEEEQLVSELKNTTVQSIDGFLQVLEKGLKEAVLVVVGSEEAIEKDKSIFDLIRKAIQ